jgi:hypothetical protein
MKSNCWNGPIPLGHDLPGPAHGAFRTEAKARELRGARQRCRFRWAAARWGGAVGRRDGRWGGGLDFITGELGGLPHGGVHRGVARPEGNGGEGRRSVVEVDGSWLRKVVETRAVIGAAATKHIGGRRWLGSGSHLEQRQTMGCKVERTRWERWSRDGSREV